MPTIEIRRGKGVSSKPVSLPTFRAPNTGSGAKARGVSDLTQALTTVGVEAIEKRNKAIDTSYVTDSVIKSNEEITRLGDEMLRNRENADGFANDFIVEADKVQKSFIDNAPSDQAKQTLQRNFASSRVSAYNSAFRSENEKLVKDIHGKVQENIDLISNRVFENPDSFQGSIAQLDALIASTDGVLDKTNQEILRRNTTKEVLSSYTMGLAEKGRIDEAEAVLKTDQANTALDAKDQRVLQSAIDAKASEIQKDTVRLQKEKVDKINTQFLEAEQGNQLSVNDIMSSDLPAIGVGSKDYWLKRKSKIAADDKGDPRAYSQVVTDVEEMSVEEIYGLGDPDRSEIAGLSRPLTGKQIQGLLDVKDKETDQIVKTFLKGIKPSITGSNALLNVFDEKGDQRFMEATFEVNRMIKEQKDEGFSASEMFTPGTATYKKFGGAVLNKYNADEEVRLSNRVQSEEVAAAKVLGSTKTDEELAIDQAMKATGLSREKIIARMKELND